MTLGISSVCAGGLYELPDLNAKYRLRIEARCNIPI
jgi:hypothetical protein